MYRNQNGILEIFVTANDGHIYHKRQQSPDSSLWSDWISLGSPGSSPTTGIKTIGSIDGTLELYIQRTNGEIYTKTQLYPMGAWSKWRSLGCPTGFTLHGSPAICRNIDGTLEIFRISSDNSFRGQLFHTSQLRPGWVNEWRSLGDPLGIRADSESPLLVTPSVVRNYTGALELFVSGLYGSRPRISHKWQLSPMEEWSEWSEINLDYN